MDFGTYVKKTYGNASRKSRHYTKQSPFETSNRRIRGLILKALLASPQEESSLAQHLKIPQEIIEKNIKQLTAEGFIVQDKTLLKLA